METTSLIYTKFQMDEIKALHFLFKIISVTKVR